MVKCNDMGFIRKLVFETNETLFNNSTIMTYTYFKNNYIFHAITLHHFRKIHTSCVAQKCNIKKDSYYSGNYTFRYFKTTTFISQKY